MSTTPLNRVGEMFRRMYRDNENGLLMGVCAGLADYFGFNLSVVRVVAALLLILAFVPTAVIYVLAGILLREKPLCFRGENNERSFWQRATNRHG